MSKIALSGNASGTGTLTIAAPNTNTDRTLTLPDNTGTVLTSASNLAGVTGVGKVLQVVSTSTFISFSTSSTSYVDTGLSVTITPSAASSRIMLLYSGAWNIRAANTAIELAFVRNSTNLGKQSALYAATHSGFLTTPVACLHVDSPASTSSIVYKIFVKEAGLAGTVGLSDDVLHTFIAQEIAA